MFLALEPEELMPELSRDELAECRVGDCMPSEDAIREQFCYVKGISSRTGGKIFHVIEARNGFHAFVEMNGKFYATGSYPSLRDLEGYVF